VLACVCVCAHACVVCVHVFGVHVCACVCACTLLLKHCALLSGNDALCVCIPAHVQAFEGDLESIQNQKQMLQAASAPQQQVRGAESEGVHLLSERD
jgi:hypothetical protein